MNVSKQQTLATNHKLYYWLKQTIIVFSASAAISAFCALAIPLPFTPVPIVLQTHVVLFLAIALGSKRASLATLLFLAQGASGLPVFAGAQGGMAILFGPRGGYLLGYVAAAYLTGLLAERLGKTSMQRILLAIAIGNFTIFACGLPWLANFVGWQNVLLLGFFPFVAGEIMKTIAFASLYKTLVSLRQTPSTVENAKD